MVPRRLLVLAGSLLVLVLGASASAMQHVGGGTATIAGSGTSWSLTIANTGTEPIKCWRYTFPPGIQATAIKSPPSGWQVGGNKPPPAPILGGRSDAGIAPNGKATFGFTTDRPFDTGRRLAGLVVDPPGVAAGSTDCVSDFTMPVTYGSTPPPPKPKCQCKSLEIVEGNYTRQGRYDLGFNVDWKLTCTPQGGGGCRGKIEVVPPKSKNLHFVVVVPKDRERICKGSCARPKTGPAFVRLRAEDDRDGTFGFGDRKGQTFRFKLNLLCRRGAGFVRVGTQAVEIAYDEEGKFDPKQSDMNANGTPDGDEKKK